VAVAPGSRRAPRLVGLLLSLSTLRSVEGHADAGFSVPGAAPESYFLTQWRAVATYLRLLAWPAGQNADWSFPMSRSLAEPAVLAAGALLAGMLGGAGLLWWRCRRGDDAASGDGRAAAYGVAWFFLAAALAGSRLLDRVAARRRTLAAARAVGLAWAVLAVALHLRNAVWESDLALWSDVVEKSPARARARLGLGMAMVQREDLRGAAAAFAAGLDRVAPDATALRVSLLHNLGGALIRLGRASEAVAPLRRAIELDPAGTFAPQSLTVALWTTGDLDGAEAAARDALARVPGSGVAAAVMGQVRMVRGDDAGAIPFLEAAARADPADASARYNLGGAYANVGRLEEACDAWRSVLRTPAEAAAHEGARRNLATLGCPP
jgi:Flp pilus assembly protein TadD